MAILPPRPHLLRQEEDLVVGFAHPTWDENTRAAVRRGLLLRSDPIAPKQIPLAMLYDADGSRLYERIVAEASSYYPYAAEEELLLRHGASMAACIPPQCRIVELGCGTATKTSHLLNAVQALHGRCQYVGIDISGTALIAAQQNLEAQVEGLVGTSSLTFIEDDNLRGIERARAMFPDDCFCILWMGSSIGNFDRDHAISLLQQVRQTVGPNCLFLLCTDLWKDEETLYKAYCDDEGITELFIKNGMKNALAVLGYEATDEEHDAWRYHVEINKELRRVEMWVIFPDGLTVERHGLHIGKGERVLIEFSRKFSIEDIEELANSSGFCIQQAWRSRLYSCQMLYSAQQALLSCWSDTDALFDRIRDWSARPIDLRHPFLFYYGHVAAFASLRLHGRLPADPKHSDMDAIFSRGIDPCVLDPAICHEHPEIPAQWPPRESIEEYVRNVRSSVLMESAEEEEGPLPMYRVRLLLEHERMHQETLEYMLAQQTKLEFERSKDPGCDGARSTAAKRSAVGVADDDGDGGMVLIAPGKVSMGRDSGEVEKALFAWDNEMPRTEGEVSEAFMVSSKAVSIAQFKAFVEDGGYEKAANWPRDFGYFEANGYKWPATWSKVGGELYVHGPYGTHHWKEVKEDPVYVSLAEAMAYCKWFGDHHHQDQDQDQHQEQDQHQDHRRRRHHHRVMRIMTEEEYHRALDESDRSDGGDDAVAVMDLRSGGWEWTCSPFAGFPGFQAMEEYREYSADFFDGNHFVLKGSSPATHPSLRRDSFRNFYQRQYRYVFAKFRCCFTAGGSSGRC